MMHRPHQHGAPSPDARVSTVRRLGLVLALTGGYAAAEVVGGWLANSLALLADAAHMLTDMLALGLALVAAWSARRPPDPSRTYGYKRAEILAALLNAVGLIVISVFICLEAFERMRTPPEVEHRLMAAVAAGGLAINLLAARLLHGHQHGMNVRGAYLHVLGDLLGSLGALLAAAAIAFFGWAWADPAISLVIAGIIVFSAVRLALDAVNVLMEGAPAHLDAREIQGRLEALDGVGGVHDLHVWSLGGEEPLLTAHLVLDHTAPHAAVLRRAARMLRRDYGIDHATLQIEPPDYNIVLGLED